jgi:hypothetical protein
MPRFVKLDIATTGSCPHSSTPLMFNVFPNLERIEQQTIDLRDESFATTNRCRRLKHINIPHMFFQLIFN